MKKAFEIKSKTFLQVSKVLSFRPKKQTFIKKTDMYTLYIF